MRTHLALTSLVLLGTQTAAFAQASVRDPVKVEGGNYAIEPYHTRILFAVSHLGFTTYYGDFTKTSGKLDLQSADPAKSAFDIKIDTASVSTTNAKLDEELKSQDWLDAQKFPAITYKSVAVIVTGKDRARIEGNLTLHGMTKPVSLSVNFNGAGINPLDKHYTVGFEATGTIKRSDFGVTKYVPLVGDDVKLIISAAFERQE